MGMNCIFDNDTLVSLFEFICPRVYYNFYTNTFHKPLSCCCPFSFSFYSNVFQRQESVIFSKIYYRYVDRDASVMANGLLRAS